MLTTLISRINRSNAVVLAFLLQAAFAQTALANGQNCAVNAPPPNSSQVILPGVPVQFTVYPDGAFINAGYSGCQTVWAQGQPYILARFENGVLQNYDVAPIGSNQAKRCVYVNKTLAPSQDKSCFPYGILPFKGKPQG